MRDSGGYSGLQNDSEGRENFTRYGSGVGIIYKHSKGLCMEQLDSKGLHIEQLDGKGLCIEQLDINKEELEGEDIAVFKSQGMKGKGKKRRFCLDCMLHNGGGS